MKNKTLHLFVGPSASGKTTVANELEGMGCYHMFENGSLKMAYLGKQVRSYTTRPPRYENEDGHIFVTDEEFNKLTNIVAYTTYNNYRYCTTKEQLDEVNMYVVDIDGVHTLLDNYITERPIKIWYFDASINTRIHRMLDRGDSDIAIISRLLNDEQYNWYDRLRILVDYYQTFKNKDNIDLRSIDADEQLHEVVCKIKGYMEEWYL